MSPRITQNNANKSERNIGKVGLRFYALRFRNAFVFQAWIVPKIHEKTKFKSGCVQIEAGANDRVTLALVNDLSHLIRVNSRDSRASEKLLAFPSVRAVQFRVQPYPGKFPITPHRYP